jgi:hypothetical protein
MTDQVDNNAGADRYPPLTKVLQTIIGQADLPEGPVERLEVHVFASGDATYRVWEPRADESEGGYLEPM